ncbi:MAG: FtsX-like permease family protein [Hyphomicrobium sp.]
MTTTDAGAVAGARPGMALPAVVRLALRELRGGLGGFYVFIACVALGVMVITAVGALSDALRSGLERQGREIIGGDVTLARMHARAEPKERAWFAGQGRTSETATLRTMARRLDGEDQSLAEVKAVDAAYPLVGALKLEEATTVDAAIRTGSGAAVEAILLERLGLKIGDRMSLGKTEVEIRATLAKEPDQLVDRLTYGPRVLVSLDTLEATGLVQPGTLIRWRYALALNDAAGAVPNSAPATDDAAALVGFRAKVKADLPEAGFTVTDRRDPSPQVSRTLERLRQFLTLIGLTALLVGGVGVANAVNTFVDKRRKVIATMKSVGAPSGTVFLIFLIQILAVAAIGVAIGLVLGYLVPGVLQHLYGEALPVRVELEVSGRSLAIAALYGLLVALLFALWPLGRAERVSAAVLFRDEVTSERAWPRLRIVVAMALVLLGLGGVAVLTSESQKLALMFCGGLFVVFAVFLALGHTVTWLARRAPRSRVPEIALAVGNIGAPGGLARSVVMSLGAGLSLLVAVALTDSSLVNELTSRLPERSPNYFLLDIAKDDYPGIVTTVGAASPAAEVSSAPMLRGRVVRLKGVPVEEIKAPPEASWVLNGDRGLSYAEAVPDGSKVVAGQWWAADHAGEQLVSFEVDLARKLGLTIGDEVTVNVLGRNITARISNLREVNWESLAINFVMVFSPNTLKAAPHNLLATILLPKGTSLADEAAIGRRLAKAFPAVTAIRVKDALDAFNAIFVKVMTAVRVAGSVTLVAGALVLAGALVTAQRRRVLEAVILKTLGATRRRIIGVHLVEYLTLAAVTALFAVGLGSIAAWATLKFVMDVEFTFSWTAVGIALGLAVGLVVLFGGLGTLQVLRARPVPYLRSE